MFILYENEIFNNQSLKKEIRIKFFDSNFFVPKTFNNAKIIQRTEKEKEEIENIHNILSKPSTYIDIGANIGYWTFARNYVLKNDIKFFCFEPSSLNYVFLKKNLSRFQNIKIMNCGLSDQIEKRNLSFPYWEKRQFRQLNTGLLSLYGKTNINAENVKLITLDSFFKNQKFGKSIYVKIDTEGHEFKVLKGSQQFLKQDLDIIIQIELNFMIENVLKEDNFKKIINLLTSLDYKAFIIHSNNIKLLEKSEIEDIIIKKLSLEIYFKKNNK